MVLRVSTMRCERSRHAYWRRNGSPYASDASVAAAAGIDRRSTEPWIASADPLRRGGSLALGEQPIQPLET